MKLKNLLIPTDFSTRCNAAAEHALMLAGKFDGHVTFVHVIPGMPYEGTDDELFHGPRGDVVTGRELDEYYRQRLDRFVTDLSVGVPHSEIVLKGDAAREISNYVAAHEIDLVVAPTHGRGQFRKMLLGSVTAKLLHDLDCPVLTSSHMEQPSASAHAYTHIACATDLSSRASEVLAWAAEFAKLWDAQLTVIHATPPIGLVGPAPLPIQDEWVRQAIARAKGDAQLLMHQLNISDAALEIGEGNPVPFAATTAGRIGADLLVIGRGLAHERSARLPTHAYGIIRESPCPVLSV